MKIYTLFAGTEERVEPRCGIGFGTIPGFGSDSAGNPEIEESLGVQRVHE